MLTPAEAEALICARVPGMPIETRALATIPGAVLRQGVVAERDQPPFDRATMDGIALDSSAWLAGRRHFRGVGTQAAGYPALRLTSTEDCLEVMTGAVLPSGCDCIVPIERLRSSDAGYEIEAGFQLMPFLNVHRRGTDCLAGDALLTPGTQLGGTELAVVASAGLAQVQVSVEPRILIVTTGDELIEPGQPIEDWQVRRSNAAALRAALATRGFQQLADVHLSDDAEQLRAALAAHLESHDVLVLTGGVSMGRFDHVPAALAELGVEQVFHKVAQRPGKPMWFGVSASGKAVYALPGNPVSALVCLVRYVVPGLRSAMRATPSTPRMVALAEAFEVRPALSYFLPVRLQHDERCGMTALPRPTHGSGDFVSLLGTDGFVELPPGPVACASGQLAPLYLWNGP